VYDPDTQQVLWEEHSQDQRSIASITKVMTALVFLESDPDLSEMITVTRPDVSHASTTHLRSNDRLEAGDLLHLLLISSDDAAAPARERSAGRGRRTRRALQRRAFPRNAEPLQLVHVQGPGDLLHPHDPRRAGTVASFTPSTRAASPTRRAAASQSSPR